LQDFAAELNLEPYAENPAPAPRVSVQQAPANA
jgi:hypothetical protein